MRIIKTTVYSYGELSPQAQQKAREWYINGFDFTWSAECVIDDAKTIAVLFGLDVDRVFYSGFWSQGDGASFEGSYRYAKGALKAVKEYAPLDDRLHSIVARLGDLQRRNFYQLRATCEHYGHYYHSGCMRVDCEDIRNNDASCSRYVEDDLTDLLREFADWIYKRLRDEYEYQTSEEQIVESIEANDYEFTAEGAIV